MRQKQFRLIGTPHPFHEETEALMPVGATVEECLTQAGVTPGSSVSVWLNGRWVPLEHYMRVRPKADTTLRYQVRPQGGLFRSILLLGVMAAALAASFLVPPLFGLAAGTAAFALVGAGAGLAISVVGSLLVNALVPVRPPRLTAASAQNPAVAGGGRPEASPTFSLTAPTNDTRQWGPVPVILGRHRVTPPYGALPYTEISGNEQYIHALFIWGYAPLSVTDIRLGDTPISQFAEVQIETFQNYPTDGPLTLVTHPVFEEALSLQLLQVNGFQQRTTARTITRLSVDIVLPQGLAQLSQDGDLLTSHVNLQVDYRLAGGSVWTPLVIPGTEAQIASDSFTLTNAWEGTPGASDPSSRGARIWLNTTTGLLELAETGLISIGAETFPAVPAHARSIVRLKVVGDNITRLTQELDDALMGFAITNPTGRQVDIAGGTFFSSSTTITDATQTAIRVTLASVDVSPGQYEVRVARITPDTEEPSLINTVFWATLRSERVGTPVLSFDQPLTVTAVRIRASAQLNGPLNNVNGIAESVLLKWDPNAASWGAVATTNNASMLRAVLQGPATPKPLPDSALDLPSIQDWSGYCDLRGLHFNMPRDFRASVWETVLDICSAGRATIVLQDNGQWGVVIDELQVGLGAVQHFSERNSWEFRAEKSFRQMPHAFRLRYLNEDKDWRQDEAFAYADGFGAQNATLFEQLELPGHTDETTLIKQARYMMAQALLRPETYSFSVDFEHLLCNRGSRIRVTPFWGLGSGRVKAVDTDNQIVVLDTVVTMRAGHTYAARFRLSDGSSVLRPVVTDARDTDTLQLTSIDVMPSVGDLALFGESGQESMPLIVTRKEPMDQWSARVYCVDEAPGIHEADSGPMAIFDPALSIPVEHRIIRNGGFDWEPAGVWVFDDAAAQSIEITSTQARSGRRALRITSAGMGKWARPNDQEPVAITQGQRVYVEGWGQSESGNGQAVLALGWYTSEWYLYKAVMGQLVNLSTTYQRLKVDDLPSASGVYVHAQVRATGSSGNAWLDDALGFPYTLPIVLPSTLSQTSNYVRMQDQSGGIWQLSILEGWPALDNVTEGTQLNPGETWAWIRRTSPDLTFYYLYPDEDGVLQVSNTQPSVGVGSTAALSFTDKYDWQLSDLAADDDGGYLVEAA